MGSNCYAKKSKDDIVSAFREFDKGIFLWSLFLLPMEFQH
jgi:hypothetical protein